MNDQAQIQHYESPEDKAASIVARIKEEQPGIRLFQVVIPDDPTAIYIARKSSWSEYKTMLGTVKNEAQASETIIQRFLVYPKPDYEAMQTEWDPGLIMTLAQQIQKGLGFTQGASVKNW